MLIRNAKDSAGKAIEVWLRDGKIAAVGLGLLVPEGEEVLDAKGRTVLPAFIDTHCHWRTPGFEYKEDISTGSAAAAAGGYTFVNLMPNTKPVCSSAEIAHAVEAEAARVGLCDANQTVSITKDFDGKTLDHLLTLPEDIKFITEDGNGVPRRGPRDQPLGLPPGREHRDRAQLPSGRVLRHPAAHVPRLHQGIRRCRPHEPDARCAGQLRGHTAPPVV